MKSVLLCGCGNIGFRHLQAMMSLPDPVAITIVEPDVATYARITAAIAPAQAKGFVIGLHPAMPKTAQHFDLAVIATSAETRRVAFDDLVARHDVGLVIFEKVLFQTRADLHEVGRILTSRGISAYVNCPRRLFSGYRALRDGADLRRPVHVTVTGAAFGLASNAAHMIDLAEFLNGAAMTAFDARGLRPGSVAAKRAGCVEVFGTISGQLSNGAQLRITCEDRNPMALRVALDDTTGQGWKIDEMARTIFHPGQTTAQPFEIKLQSEMWEVYHHAFTTGTCGLTPYADSARQHHLLLQAISGHLGLVDAAPCPIS